MATNCNATFIALSGAQIYSPFVGDSERTLRNAFKEARTLSPSILFLDEVGWQTRGDRRETGESGGCF